MIGVNFKGMFEHSTVDDCKLLELPEINMERGCITPIGSGNEVAFDIKRIYFLFDVLTSPPAVDMRTNPCVS